MNTQWLHTVLKQLRANFLAHFHALTEQDVGAILVGQSETLLIVLQQRYDYTRPQAKAAWNEFVLRYVDGHGSLSHSGLPTGRRVGVVYPKPGMVSKRPLRQVHWRIWSRTVSTARLLR